MDEKRFRVTANIPGCDLLPGEYLDKRYAKKIKLWLKNSWIVDKKPEVKIGNRKNTSKMD